MLLERPLFGYGYGTFQEAKKEYLLRNEMFSVSDDSFIEEKAGFHDTYMGILLDLGLLGFGLYLFIIFYILSSCMRLYIKSPQGEFLGKDFAVISFGIFLVLLIKIQSSDLRYFIFPNCIFFSMAGIVAGLSQRISQRNNISPANRKI
jgi:O-antigen ligase